VPSFAASFAAGPVPAPLLDELELLEELAPLDEPELLDVLEPLDEVEPPDELELLDVLEPAPLDDPELLEVLEPLDEVEPPEELELLDALEPLEEAVLLAAGSPVVEEVPAPPQADSAAQTRTNRVDGRGARSMGMNNQSLELRLEEGIRPQPAQDTSSRQ
jgi:hypothetical protein